MCQSNAPYLLQFVQPLAALLIGIGAMIIAWRQWITAHERLRLDLFDRRIEGLTSIFSFVSKMYSSNKFSYQECTNAQLAVERTKLLFGEDVERLLDQVGSELRDIWRHEFTTPDDKEHLASHYSFRMSSSAKLVEMYRDLGVATKPYLQIDVKNIGFWRVGS